MINALALAITITITITSAKPTKAGPSLQDFVQEI